MIIFVNARTAEHRKFLLLSSVSEGRLLAFSYRMIMSLNQKFESAGIGWAFQENRSLPQNKDR
jgi:hypothetical protein